MLSNCGNTLNVADMDATFKVFVAMNNIIPADYVDLISRTLESLWAETSYLPRGV